MSRFSPEIRESTVVQKPEELITQDLGIYTDLFGRQFSLDVSPELTMGTRGATQNGRYFVGCQTEKTFCRMYPEISVRESSLDNATAALLRILTQLGFKKV